MTGDNAGDADSVCCLCGQPRGQLPVVQTVSGNFAHIACADRAALQAWRLRSVLALTHGGAAIAGLLLWGAMVGVTPLLVSLALLSATLHARLHRRWWQITARDLRQLLRDY